MNKHLSPLNNQLLIERCRSLLGKPESIEIEGVTQYRCPQCDDLHDDEEEAETCCTSTAASTDCPVCGEHYQSHRDAADCCLWKDLGAIERWNIADTVEAGLSWAEALGIEI